MLLPIHLSLWLYNVVRSHITAGVSMNQVKASPAMMGGHLTSRLECVHCRAKYVSPFVDRSLDLPFTLPSQLKVYSNSVTEASFAQSH